MLSKKIVVLFLLVSLILAACGPEIAPPAAAPAQEVTSVPQATLEPTPEPVEARRSAGELATPALKSLAAAAITDLVQRLNVDAASVQVLSAEEVVWPDASLGCPQPGMAYAQVMTDGMQVLLKVDDQIYAYHGRTPDDLFLCETGGPAEEAGEMEGSRSAAPNLNLSAKAQALVNTVTADMATELGVAEAAIEVKSVESADWRNSGLGCEKKGEVYLQVITPGYKIVLQAGDSVFEYHTDAGSRYVLCAQMSR